MAELRRALDDPADIPPLLADLSMLLEQQLAATGATQVIVAIEGPTGITLTDWPIVPTAAYNGG